MTSIMFVRSFLAMIKFYRPSLDVATNQSGLHREFNQHKERLDIHDTGHYPMIRDCKYTLASHGNMKHQKK